MAGNSDSKAAGAALARHLARGATLHLPSDIGIRLKALTGVAIVASSLIASGLSPIVQPAAAAAAAPASTAAEQVLEGGVDLKAPLTDEVASKMIQGVKESLYREVPEARGRVDFLDTFGGAGAEAEAKRVMRSLAVGGTDRVGRMERYEDIESLALGIQSAGAVQGMAISFERGVGVSGEGAADPKEQVCVIGVAASVLSVDGQTVRQPAGVFANFLLHETAHCLQTVLRGDSLGMGQNGAASGTEYADAIRGEVEAESFAHHLMAMNGAGTEFMQARVLNTKALTWKYMSDPLDLAYQFAPALDAMTVSYADAPRGAFAPGQLDGLREAFARAGQTAEAYAPVIAANAQAAMPATEATHNKVLEIASEHGEKDGPAMARSWLEGQADVDPVLGAARQAAADYVAWAAKGVPLESTVTAMETFPQAAAFVAPDPADRAACSSGAELPACAEAALKADLDAGAAVVGATGGSGKAEFELSEADGSKSFVLVTDKAVLRYDADRHNVSLSPDRPAVQKADGSSIHRIHDDQGNVVVASKAEAEAYFLAGPHAPAPR